MVGRGRRVAAAVPRYLAQLRGPASSKQSGKVGNGSKTSRRSPSTAYGFRASLYKCTLAVLLSSCRVARAAASGDRMASAMGVLSGEGSRMRLVCPAASCEHRMSNYHHTFSGGAPPPGSEAPSNVDLVMSVRLLIHPKP